MVWGPRDANTLFDVLQTVVAPLLGEEEESADSPMFGFAASGALNRAFEKAGYGQVQEIELNFGPEIDAGEPFWRPFLGMSFGNTLTDLAADLRSEIDDAARAGSEKHLIDGKYRLNVHARIGVGTAPEK